VTKGEELEKLDFYIKYYQDEQKEFHSAFKLGLIARLLAYRKLLEGK